MAKKMYAEVGGVFMDARKRAGFSSKEGELETLLFADKSTIARIEEGKRLPTREEVCRMAEVYHAPELEDYYCTHVCELGMHRKQLEYEDIGAVTRDLSYSLSILTDNARLIAGITIDNVISEDEQQNWLNIMDFAANASYFAHSVELWSRKNEISEGNMESAEPSTLPKSGNAYLAARKQQFPKQKDAIMAHGIVRQKLSPIESENEAVRQKPTPEQVIKMSKAYLSPRLRNFYCYYDCPIGGRMEPLDVSNTSAVCNTLVSNLWLIQDTNTQLRRLLRDEQITISEQAEFLEVLEQLKTFARTADRIVLYTQEQLTRRLRTILADGQVTEKERAEFEQILKDLERLGSPVKQLDELRTAYLTEV